MMEKLQHSMTYYSGHEEYFDYLKLSKVNDANCYQLINSKLYNDKFMNIFDDKWEHLKIEKDNGDTVDIRGVFIKDNIVVYYKKEHINLEAEEEENYEDYTEEINSTNNNTTEVINYIDISYNKHTENEKIELVKKIKAAEIKKDNINYFYTVGLNRSGYVLEKHRLINNETNLNLYYGDGFENEYETIKNKIKSSNDGLFLFWGKPGTGKTSFIKHLISNIEKKVIYLPSFMIGNLSQPEFITFLKNYKNIILLLEDAEHAIMDRNLTTSSSSVSNILNLTNGLLNDIIKVQIIATFNTKKENIDKALLREGRLKHEKEFKELSIEQSKKLVEHLKLDYKVTEEMTLAQVFNINDYELNKNKKDSGLNRKIGF